MKQKGGSRRNRTRRLRGGALDVTGPTSSIVPPPGGSTRPISPSATQASRAQNEDTLRTLVRTITRNRTINNLLPTLTRTGMAVLSAPSVMNFMIDSAIRVLKDPEVKSALLTALNSIN